MEVSHAVLAPILSVHVIVHPVEDGDQPVGRVEGSSHRPLGAAADVEQLL